MSISEIQAGLKAPKGQTNKFGNYKYRSCEDIVEAVKPLLAGFNYHLTISDEIMLIGDRYYVKATASVMSDEQVVSTACAFARETLSRKGMDDAQLTGATSSYARKYALNGLFAIDDTKDADTTDNRDIKQVNPEPIRIKFVDRAEERYRELLDDDETDEDVLAEHFKVVDRNLSNDERMAVADRFKGEAWGHGTKKNTITVINEYLKQEKAA